MIVKVKEPQPAEWRSCAPARSSSPTSTSPPIPTQARGLMASGVTAIAYETVTDARGGLPLLAPMSEVAGRMSIAGRRDCLQKAQRRPRHAARRRARRARRPRSSCIGGGVVGTNAARMAVGLGADVTILDRSLPRLRAARRAVRRAASCTPLLDPRGGRRGSCSTPTS